MARIAFKNGDIRENGQILGRLHDDVIRNNVGAVLCRTRNDEIRNNAGTLIGKVKDGVVRSPTGMRLGNVKDYMIDGMEHEKDVNIVAAYHFLVKKFF